MRNFQVRPLSARRMAVSAALGTGLLAPAAALHAQDKPLMRGFMGLDVHAAAIEQAGHTDDAPGLYSSAVHLVRDYHPLSWNLNGGGDATYPTDKWNWINWSSLYGQWVAAGYEVNPAIQFNNSDLSAWSSDLAGQAYDYGYAFANALGSAHGSGVIGSAQIGNEVGTGVPEATFKTVFTSMAAGIRAADPGLLIVTPSVTAGPAGQYSNSLSEFVDITDSFDVISMNTYAAVQGYPTWERTYPESSDPRLTQLANIQAVIDWRNENAPGKQIWITEFGYDASTAPNHTNDEFTQWQGVSDTQQAQWLTRSMLVFSAMDVDRAYIYFYDDANSPTVHGSSGLTRDWEPKASYYAMTHMQQTLGDYRFDKAIRADDDAQANPLYVYQFVSGINADEVIWAIWSPTGDGRQVVMTLDGLPGLVQYAEQMPLAEGAAPRVNITTLPDGQVSLLVGESPIYLHLLVPEPTGAALTGLPMLWLTYRRARRI